MTKSCERYLHAIVDITSLNQTKSANTSIKQGYTSTAHFATFSLRVPSSKLMICLLILIESSGGALCFVPIQYRRKPKSIFIISEKTQHLYQTGTTQKLVPSESTIYFK